MTAALPVLAALLWTSAGCGGTPPSTAERFDGLWRTFDERYALFGVKSVDWAALRERYQPRAASTRDDVSLAAIVRAMMAELRDPHVWLRAPSGASEATYQPSGPVNFDAPAWQAWTLAHGAAHRVHWGYGSLGAVPYVWVDAWTSALPMDEIEAWFETVRDAPALVFDVRMNPGGDDRLARAVASRFADRERTTLRVRERAGPGHDDLTEPMEIRIGPAGAWQFTRPVLLLAGRATASSAEEFVSAMRELPHVTVAGEPTMGTTGNPEWHDLGNGWSYTVSKWRCTTADGLEIEDHGIPPDLAIAAAREDFAAGRDPVLEYAESWAAAQQP